MHEPYSAFFPFDFNSCAVGNAHTSHCPICSAVAAFFSSKFEDISVDEEKREEALGICRGGEDRFLGTWCFPYTIFRVLCLKSFIQEMTEFHELEKPRKSVHFSDVFIILSHLVVLENATILHHPFTP